MIRYSPLTHGWDLTSITTPDQSEPGIHGNEMLLHIPQSCKTGVSPSDAVWCHISGHSLDGGGSSYTVRI